MSRRNSSNVSPNYLDFVDPVSTVAAGESESKDARQWSGNSREHNKNQLRPRLPLEDELYWLSGILSLSLICLILINLVWAAPSSINADSSEIKPVLTNGPGREKDLANVRAVLREKIHRELVTLRRVFDDVNFHLEDNDIVTLSGQVRLTSLKVSAERAARDIEGVKGVINRVEVLPTSSFDGFLRRAAEPTQLLRSTSCSVESKHREKRQADTGSCCQRVRQNHHRHSCQSSIECV